MEQSSHQPKGDADEISSQEYNQYQCPNQYEHLHGLPADVGRDVDVHEQLPPVTFAEAEAHNPFALLIELHDHALGRGALEQRAEFHLTELALSAAVVAWWSRWQPISMHRAFVAGAALSDVAGATGMTEPEAYRRWSKWAEVQANLVIAGRPGVDGTELAEIHRHIGVDSLAK